MVRKSRLDILNLLDNVSYNEYRSTSELAKKLNISWAIMFSKLLYLEYKGYVKFIEIRNEQKNYFNTYYAWKKLHENDEKNTSLSKSFLELLEHLREDIFESTTLIATKTRENNYVLKAKLLYLESRKYVVCFRLKGKIKNVAYNWKKLTNEEREKYKDEDRKKIEQRYEKECFRYTE